MKNKLLVYGFSEEQAAALVRGKEVRVFYGLVRLKKTGELITKYNDGRVEKIEQL
jgi:hypothetical protein